MNLTYSSHLGGTWKPCTSPLLVEHGESETVRHAHGGAGIGIVEKAKAAL